MAYLDTRDLADERDNLTNDILQAWNDYQEEKLGGEFGDCEDFDDVMQFAENLKDNGSLDFLIAWDNEITEVREINDLENEVGSEWEYGVTLIEEDDFEDYCQELVEDIGDLPRDLPSYISNNIDWSGVADNLRQDYSEVEFRGTTYLYR